MNDLPRLSSANEILRLRVFAGPNVSGKSTIITAVRNYKVKDIPVDFGIYVNADDIARTLREQKFSFQKYKLSVSNQEFIETALATRILILVRGFTQTIDTSIFKRSSIPLVQVFRSIA